MQVWRWMKTVMEDREAAPPAATSWRVARPVPYSGASCKACGVLDWKPTCLRTRSVVLTEHQTLHSL